MAVSIDFNQAPEKNIEYLESKGHKLTFDYEEMLRDAHKQAFTVAKVMRNDLLMELQESLTKSMQAGTTFDQWKKDIKPTLASYGWLGQTDVTDPRTGEVKTINVDSRRLETIYQTNMHTAQAKARHDEMMNLNDAVYWRYMCRKPETSRHGDWHGTVRHRDDPWWQTHYPPNGWGCLCYVTAHTLKECLSKGWPVLTAAKKAKGDDVDSDWAYNPGDTAKLAKFEKVQIDASTLAELAKLVPEPKYKELTSAELKAAFFKDMGIKEGGTFIDKVGDPIVLDDKLFTDGSGADKITKGNRHLFLSEFASVIQDPDEILMDWETLNYPSDQYMKGDTRLVKKMVKHYVNPKGQHRMLVAVIEYRKDKTQGVTLHMGDKPKKTSGKLIYKK